MSNLKSIFKNKDKNNVLDKMKSVVEKLIEVPLFKSDFYDFDVNYIKSYVEKNEYNYIWIVYRGGTRILPTYDCFIKNEMFKSENKRFLIKSLNINISILEHYSPDVLSKNIEYYFFNRDFFKKVEYSDLKSELQKFKSYKQNLHF